MITVSNDIKNMLQADARNLDMRILKASDRSVVDCSIKNISIHKGACGEFQVGTVYVPYADITMDYDVALPSKIILQCGAKVGNSYSYFDIGHFIPITSKKSPYTTTANCQGILYTANEVLYASEPTSRTLNDLLTAIRGKGYSVTLNNITLPSASVGSALLGLSVRDVFQIIASCVGGFVTEDNSGGIVISRFNPCTTSSLNLSGERSMEIPEFKGEFVVSGCKVIVDEETVYEETPNNVVIENPYFTSGMWNTFKGNLTGLTFESGTFNVSLGDPRLEAWDCVKITDDDSVDHFIPCLTLTFNYDGALTMDIEAEVELDEENEVSGFITQRVLELSTKVERVRVDVTDVETAVSGLGTRVTTAEGNISTVESAIGNPSDSASASGSLYARVKNAKNVSDQAVAEIQAEVTRAQQTEQQIEGIAEQASADAHSASISASIAQSASEASIEANYRKYNAITMTASDIATKCAHGYSGSWERSTAEGYYQGACNVGDVLLIYVTKPDNKVGKLLVRVTTTSSAGQPTTGTTISWDDNINAYFYHDSQGAHIVSGSDSNYRTDVASDGMSITEIATGKIVAFFRAAGATIGKALSNRFEVKSNKLEAYDSNNNKYFEVSAEELTFGSNTAATSAEVESKVDSSEVFGTTVYTYMSGSMTYDVYKDEEGYYYTDDDGIRHTVEYDSLLDENGTPVGTSGKEPVTRIEGGIANDVNSLSEQLDGYSENLSQISDSVTNVQNSLAGELVASGYAKIDNTVGKVSIYGKNNNDEIISTLDLESTKIDMRVGSSSAFTVESLQSGEGIVRADSSQFSNIRMRSAGGEGTLGWVAQTNGHLSLKEVLG